jgi:RNA polymerase sigma factor (TIGR02999 family)
VSEFSSTPVSELLVKWQAGDAKALEALVPLVYNELRRLAHHHLKAERPDHTLQTTELVHDAYIRLTRQDGLHCENRAHFLAISARLMRQILVAYARSRRAAKRDGGYKVTLESAESLLKERTVDLLALRRCFERSRPARSSAVPHRGVALLRRPHSRRDGAGIEHFSDHGKATLGHGPNLASPSHEWQVSGK